MVEEKKEVKEEDDIITQARKERELLEKATAAAKAENDRAEKLLTRAAMGGKSLQGQPAPPQEETPAEYARRIERGDYGRKHA